MRKRTEVKRERNRTYINNVRASSTWHQPKRPSKDRTELEHAVSEETGVNINTVRVVFKYLFGSERLGIKGIIQRMLDEGKAVDIDGFGTFGHRMRAPKITNDISQPGTMTFSPANSTITFKPSTRLYWDHYMASMAANMPDEPLPSNMHFSQRVTSMPFYKEWLERMQQSVTVTGDAIPEET